MSKAYIPAQPGWSMLVLCVDQNDVDRSTIERLPIIAWWVEHDQRTKTPCVSAYPIVFGYETDAEYQEYWAVKCPDGSLLDCTGSRLDDEKQLLSLMIDSECHMRRGRA